MAAVHGLHARYADLEHIVDQRRPINMIQFTRLIGKQFLELDPSLYVREVQELLVADHALGLQCYEAHGVTDEHELLGLHCALGQLIVRYELPKMLFRKLNCLRRLVVTYELHHQLQLKVKFELAARVLQLCFICVAPIQRRVNSLTPQRIQFNFLWIIHQIVVTVLALFLDHVV